MRAALITIGDEILIGQITNTNAVWIGQQLTSCGVDVTQMVTVADDIPAIVREVRSAVESFRIVIVTGGLGPTHDDVTKHAVAEVFGDELAFRQDIMDAVEERFRSRGRTMVQANRGQALVPVSFEAIVNTVGTAPALFRGTASAEGSGFLVILPGVPHEMETFMRQDVLPRIDKLDGQAHIAQRTLMTAGIGESNLHAKMEGLEQELGADRQLAFLPSIHGVRMRLTARAAHAADAEARLDNLVEWIRARVGDYVYGEADVTLEEVVGQRLQALRWTIGTAESCTGGLLAHRITNVPGSSAWMLGGVVSYGNSVKTRTLGVDADILDAHGAVSEQVARAMAEGARSRLGVDVAVSTTGIMGPGGGSPEKPVGTVWVGIALPTRTVAIALRLGTDRARNKERAATAALDAVRKLLPDC